MMGTMGMMGVGVLNMVLWFLIFVGIVYFVTRYVRRDVGTSGATNHRDNALQILRERYAKGEIDSATYEKMKSDLK